MKLAVTGYDWFIVDGYTDETFWKGYIELGRRTLYGKLRRKFYAN
jgi:hypothetical protein